MLLWMPSPLPLHHPHVRGPAIYCQQDGIDDEGLCLRGPRRALCRLDAHIRTAAFPQSYGHIDTDLAAGTRLDFLVFSSEFGVSICIFMNGASRRKLYRLCIVLSDLVSTSLEVKRSIVGSTTSCFGGRKYILVIAYIIVGALCMVQAIVFFVKYKLSLCKLGDTRYWPGSKYSRTTVSKNMSMEPCSRV